MPSSSRSTPSEGVFNFIDIDYGESRPSETGMFTSLGIHPTEFLIW
jgi:hypothetical protein